MFSKRLFRAVFYNYDYDPHRNTLITIPLPHHKLGGVTDWYQSHRYREPNVFKH